MKSPPARTIRSPTPARLRAARAEACLSQAASAELIQVGRRTWQDWEAGVAAMPLGLFRLYLHLTGIERLPFGR